MSRTMVASYPSATASRAPPRETTSILPSIRVVPKGKKKKTFLQRRPLAHELPAAAHISTGHYASHIGNKGCEIMSGLDDAMTKQIKVNNDKRLKEWREERARQKALRLELSAQERRIEEILRKDEEIAQKSKVLSQRVANQVQKNESTAKKVNVLVIEGDEAFDKLDLMIDVRLAGVDQEVAEAQSEAEILARNRILGRFETNVKTGYRAFSKQNKKRDAN